MIGTALNSVPHASNAARNLPSTIYPYKPLSSSSKEFRLITVSAGEGDDSLMCTLSHEDLGTCPPPTYETISYCWGDASIRDILTLNDIPISVPASTAAALRRVRLSDEARVVWLDAVCIDQSSVDERSQQVGIMGDIYRNGSCNLIYLGEDDIEEALLSIKAIVNEAAQTEGSFTLLRNEVGAWQYSSTPIQAEYTVEALIKFFAIPWFR